MTDFDSHENMVVIGRNDEIISNKRRTAEVSPFTLDCEAVYEVPVFDDSLLYMFPYTDKPCILVASNLLHVPTMNNNIISPFIIRKAGVNVNGTTKTKMLKRTVEDHSVYFIEENFSIPLELRVVLSYFPTSKSNVRMLE